MGDLPAAPEHKPISEEDAKELGDQAFKLERGIIASMKRGREAAWELAEQLYAFHEGAMWGPLGYETLDEFLAQPEIGMGRSSFFSLTKMWRDLVVVREVSPARLKELEPSKVHDVVKPIMRGEATVEAALTDVEQLGRRDLRDKYQGPRKPDAPLDAEDEPVRVQCERCGSWYVVEREDDGDSAADDSAT